MMLQGNCFDTTLPFFLRKDSTTYPGIQWRVLLWETSVNHFMTSSQPHWSDGLGTTPWEHFPELHSRRCCVSRLSVCVGTNQWPPPSKSIVRNPTFLWCPHDLLVSCHQPSLEIRGHKLRTFMLSEWRQRPWRLSDIRFHGSETS